MVEWMNQRLRSTVIPRKRNFSLRWEQVWYEIVTGVCDSVRDQRLSCSDLDFLNLFTFQVATSFSLLPEGRIISIYMPWPTIFTICNFVLWDLGNAMSIYCGNYENTLLTAETLAPALINIFTASLCPCQAAMCNGRIPNFETFQAEFNYVSSNFCKAFKSFRVVSLILSEVYITLESETCK